MLQKMLKNFGMFLLHSPKFVPANSNNTRIQCCSSKSLGLSKLVRRLKPFGKVVIDLPYDVQVRPTCPYEYPDMDTVVVTLVPQDKDNKLEDSILLNITDEACEIRWKDEKEIINEVKWLIQTPIGCGRYHTE